MNFGVIDWKHWRSDYQKLGDAGYAVKMAKFTSQSH